MMADKQINIRMSEAEEERIAALAEAEGVNRTMLLRKWVLDGMTTHETEGALLDEETAEQLREAATAEGLTELEALRAAVETWLRVREELADATRPRRFPPREVMLECGERAKAARKLLEVRS